MTENIDLIRSMHSSKNRKFLGFEFTHFNPREDNPFVSLKP